MEKEINGEIENEDRRMLLDIYKNLDMATWSIDIIDDEINDEEFLELVHNEKKMYEDIKMETMKLANKKKIDLKNINMMAKMGSFTSIKFSTFFDNSSSNIANRLIQGTSMGIIQIRKAQNCYKNISDEVKDLAEKLYQNENKFFKNLQHYL